MTAADVVELLRARHSAVSGNGEQWVFMTQVRNAAGFDASVTADAVAMHLWPSRGLALHGYEIKVSRSDWIRELRKPEKAERFARLVDFWWVVVSDEKIVQDGELPVGWGLLAVRGGRLVTIREADHRPAADLTRSFVACLLRSCFRFASSDAPEVAVARRAGYDEGFAAGSRRLDFVKNDLAKLSAEVAEFEHEAGIKITRGWGAFEPSEVGKALRSVLSGEADIRDHESRLAALEAQAERALEGIRRSRETGA
jgi:hypothetical protein